MDALDNSDVAAAKKAYQQYKTEFPDRWRDTKWPTNSLGYQLISAKRTKEAIAVFSWKVETYPDYANGWDSLGEGFMIKGDFKDAIKYYQKSLELNPENDNAKQMIQRMRSEM